jgi:hypothetical protein
MTPDAESEYRRGALRRGVVLVGATAIAAGIALVIYLLLQPPQYLARWDDHPVTVTEDGIKLELTFTGRPCDDDVAFEVVESEDQVELTAVVTEGRFSSCAGAAVPRRASVWLPHPLGDRTLLDGRCRDEDSEPSASARDCPAEPVVPEVIVE